MAKNMIHLIGFGSQGSAWAQCLAASGWHVQIYLSKKGVSFERASQMHLSPLLLQDLPAQITAGTHPHRIAILTPDSEISNIYKEWIAPVSSSVCLILAHGFALYSQELQLKHPHHQVALLAPKAIGPKLLQGFLNSFPHPHRLLAASSFPPDHRVFLLALARALGFNEDSLIEATFDQETIGDLISEQGLLCGGLFNWMDWTLEAMIEAGIPERLIQEECLSELELIVSLIRERGLAATFQSISQVAQAGTIAMSQRLEKSEFKKQFTAQMETVKNRKFADFFLQSSWRQPAQELVKRLTFWEEKIKSSKILKESL